MSSTINDLSLNHDLPLRALIGDTLITNFTKLKTLYAITNGTLNPWATPREVGSSSPYVVPASKKFVVVAVQTQAFSATVGASLGLETATSDVGFGSSSAPTGLDVNNSTSTPSQVGLIVTASELRRQSVLMIVPAGYYLAARAASRVSFHIYGYEIDANATSL